MPESIAYLAAVRRSPAYIADVLRRRILLIYGPMEAEIAKGLSGDTLEKALLILARRFVDLALAPSSIALSRILSAQGDRFPELGKLAVVCCEHAPLARGDVLCGVEAENRGIALQGANEAGSKRRRESVGGILDHL